MARSVTSAPFDLLVLVIEELLSKPGNHGIAERVGHRGVGDIEILPCCPLLQDMRYPFELGLSLTGIRAGLRQRFAELVKLDLARKLAVGAYDDTVLGFEILYLLVGIARLLSQFSDPLLQPEACAMSRLELRLDLVIRISVGKCVGDLGCLVGIKRRERDLLDIAASDAADRQIASHGFDGATR